MNNGDHYTSLLNKVIPITNVNGKLVEVHLGYFQWKEHKGRTIEELERKIYEAVNKKAK